MADQSQAPQITSDKALANTAQVTGPGSEDAALRAAAKKWLVENFLWNGELEGEIPIVSPDWQRAPLARIGPLDFRIGMYLKIKGGIEVEGIKNKFTIKHDAIGYERDLSFDGGLFDGLIKDVKLTTEVKWSSEPSLRDRMKKPVLAKIIGLEVSFDAGIILGWLRRLSEQQLTALKKARAAAGVPNSAELKPEDKKGLRFTLAFEAMEALYQRSEAINEEVKKKRGRAGSLLNLDPKTEVSLNFDPSYLTSPERILSCDIDLKTPDLSLFHLLQLTRPGFVSTGNDLGDAALQKLIVAFEAKLVVNLNASGWAALGYTGVSAGTLSMAHQAVEHGVTALRTAATSPAALIGAGAVAGTLALATLGRIAIGHELLTGRNLAIGRRFSMGYARMLAVAIDLDRTRLRSEIQQASQTSWREELEESSKLYRGSSGSSPFGTGGLLEDDILRCGKKAILDEIGKLLNEADKGFDLWEPIRRLHLNQLGAKEDPRYKYYLEKLWAQINAKQPPEEIGILLFTP